jgi:hypothetical protein
VGFFACSFRSRLIARFELLRQLALPLPGRANHVARQQGKQKVGVMNGDSASLLADVAPGLTIVSVALVAALPPYLIMHQSRHGRARASISYILGFFAGLAATALIVVTCRAHVPDATAMLSAGVLGSFFAPFAGMLRARLRRPIRRPRRHALGV